MKVHTAVNVNAPELLLQSINHLIIEISTMTMTIRVNQQTSNSTNSMAALDGGFTGPRGRKETYSRWVERRVNTD